VPPNEPLRVPPQIPPGQASPNWLKAVALGCDKKSEYHKQFERALILIGKAPDTCIGISFCYRKTPKARFYRFVIDKRGLISTLLSQHSNEESIFTA